MPLKLTCPTCTEPNRVSEPYPLPGAEIMCTRCGTAMSVSYPTGVIQKLRELGKRFSEPDASSPRDAAANAQRTSRAAGGTPAPVPPPPPPDLERTADVPTTAQDPVPRRIDLGAVPSGPAPQGPPRRRAPPPMTMPSFALTDLEDDDAPAAFKPASDAPTQAAPFTERTTSVREPAPPPPPPPRGGRPSIDPARDATSRPDAQRVPEPTAPLPTSNQPPKASSKPPKGPHPAADDGSPPRPPRSFLWRWTRRLGCLAFILVVIGAVGGTVGVAGVYWHYGKELPSVDALQDYRPPTVTEVYDRDGTLMGELYEERRYVVDFEEIPPRVRQAFIHAEDAHFYEHAGVNYVGLVRATLNEITGGDKRQGASTITMQVTRNFLLTRDKTYERKIKEIILAQRIETVYDKDRILWLYLNEIYLGSGAYGVEAAARVYFGKHLDELTVAEAALIAGLAPAPSTYSPHRNWDKARTRQLYVLDQMKRHGAIDEATWQSARDEHIEIVREENPFLILAPHFTEHVRRFIVDEYGFDAVYRDGLRVVTTMDLPVQLVAQESVVRNVHQVDQRMGFRRAGLTTLQTDDQIAAQREAQELELRQANQFAADAALREPLPERSTLEPDQVYSGVVLEAEPGWLAVGVGAHKVIVPIAWSRWAYEPNPRMSWRSRTARSFVETVRGWEDDVEPGGTLLRRGDVIQVKLVLTSSASIEGDDAEDTRKALADTPAADQDLPAAKLWQTPQVEAAAMSYDLNTGAVRAMVGGADYERSEFNRATQAERQVGSTFKPIVYAAAIDSERMRSSSIVPDVRGASYTTDAGFVWKPDNYGADYLGNITLRKALALSKNTCTVKVLESMDPGMNEDVLYTFARKLGIGGPPLHTLPEDHVPLPSNDDLCPWVRETEDSTICMDRHPPKDPDLTNTRHRALLGPDDVYMCRACDMSMGLGSASLTMAELLRAYSAFATDGRLVEPHYILKVTDRNGETLFEHEPVEFPQVIRPEVATIANWLMQNVIRGGTGYQAHKELGVTLAGKTGTTQDYKDTWFAGFSPDVITAAWVGFDEPRSLGVSSTGGRTALPIWIDIMREAAPAEKDRDFPIHGDIEWAIIDEKRGTRVTSGGRAYPFIRGTTPSSTGAAAGELTVEDFTEL